MAKNVNRDLDNLFRIISHRHHLEPLFGRAQIAGLGCILHTHEKQTLHWF